MTEEEIEWYEQNWHLNKNRGDKEKVKETNNRTYKLLCEPHISWWDNSNRNKCHYYSDRFCWKTKRKTQYHIPKVKKNKKRKEKSKEHWRYKNPIHSFYYYNKEMNKLWEKSDAKRAKLKEEQEAHFEELKKIGHFRYPDGSYKDYKKYYWSEWSQTWVKVW